MDPNQPDRNKITEPGIASRFEAAAIALRGLLEQPASSRMSIREVTALGSKASTCLALLEGGLQVNATTITLSSVDREGHDPPA